jgi:hypothetical protein
VLPPHSDVFHIARAASQLGLLLKAPKQLRTDALLLTVGDSTKLAVK